MQSNVGIAAEISGALGTSTAPQAATSRRVPEQRDQSSTTGTLAVSEGVSKGSLRDPLPRFARLLFAMDVGAILVGGAVVRLLQVPSSMIRPLAGDPAPSWQAILFFLALWMCSLAVFRAYDGQRFGSGVEQISAVLRGTLGGLLAAAAACYFLDVPVVRSAMVVMFLVGLGLMLAARCGLSTWIRHQRLAGSLSRRVLLVGPPVAISEVGEALAREPRLGLRVVGCTMTHPPAVADPDLPMPSVGSVDEISETCAWLGVDTVMVTGGADLDLRTLTWSLEGRDVDIALVPRLGDVAEGRLRARALSGLPLLQIRGPRAGRAAGWAKRAIDLTGASAAILMLAPLMLLVAALIKIGDRGPVFYRQARGGLHGQVFHVWKFRSMTVDADALDAELRSQHSYTEGIFKLKNDPRITRVGAFIRRYSIDELPQLFNVIEGTMSLVGPRPHPLVEVETYDEVARHRLRVRPGMTGLWQVSGRSNLSWTEAVRLDLSYCDNWSLMLDFAIMAKTLKAVVGKDGAY